MDPNPYQFLLFVTLMVLVSCRGWDLPGAKYLHLSQELEPLKGGPKEIRAAASSPTALQRGKPADK